MPLAAKYTKIISTVAGRRKRSQAVAGGEHPHSVKLPVCQETQNDTGPQWWAGFQLGWGWGVDTTLWLDAPPPERLS